MRQAITEIAIETPGQGLHEITGPVIRWIRAQRIDTGLATLFLRHMSAPC